MDYMLVHLSTSIVGQTFKLCFYIKADANSDPRTGIFLYDETF